MESEVKVIPEQKLGVINYKGPISDLEILISKLMGWVDAEEIETDGDLFIVYFSPRHEVNQGDAVYDVSIAIKDDADEKDNIRVVDMIEHKVLSGTHYGPTDNILDTYAKLVDIAQENHYDIIGSPKEVLVKSFFNCDNEKDYETEIQLPIIEM
jgi:effector-binding domain-containing protein